MMRLDSRIARAEAQAMIGVTTILLENGEVQPMPDLLPVLCETMRLCAIQPDAAGDVWRASEYAHHWAVLAQIRPGQGTWWDQLRERLRPYHPDPRRRRGDAD